MNIYRYVSHIMTAENVQLILEYAEGGTLSKFVNTCDSLLIEKEIIFMACQMILGLDYLHRNKIVHGDLKPSNILLMCPGVVKLADFGLSKRLDVSDSLSKPIGTLHYMAPEIFTNEKWSTPSDIWSLGCVMYFMAKKVKPFQAEAAGPLMYKIMSQPVTPIGEPYSKNLSHLVSCMMNQDQSMRPKTSDLLVDPILTCVIHTLPVLVPARVASECLNCSLEEFLQRLS